MDNWISNLAISLTVLFAFTVWLPVSVLLWWKVGDEFEKSVEKRRRNK